MFLLYNMLGGPRVYGWPGAGAGAGGGFHCARTLARRGHGAGAGWGISPVTGYYTNKLCKMLYRAQDGCKVPMFPSPASPGLLAGTGAGVVLR